MLVQSSMALAFGIETGSLWGLGRCMYVRDFRFQPQSRLDLFWPRCASNQSNKAS